ncbi:hypothetical protein M9H77_02397 [Catharanthus roseus]|uniref:Uncharacterized protein n=1 Tax=Catharanthus roseus TaxID=4058 RepID=A0ACC0C893_CATRO|nr:hypothetical protein M9H77_02397 [Catharanthus roseus]
MLYTTVTDDDTEIDHSDEEYVASSQSKSDNDAEEEDLQNPVIPITETTVTHGRATSGTATPEIPVSNIIEEVKVLFQRGCTHKPARIDGFQYCRSVISVDGTHLRGPYKGILLIASTWDANNHLFPLAFAIVDKELSES